MAEPELTEEQFVEQTIEQMMKNDDVPNCLRQLKDLSAKYPQKFMTKEAIHSLVSILEEYKNDDDLISNLFTIFWNLLNDDKTQNSQIATLILQDEQTISNLVKSIFSKTLKKRLASLK